MITNTIGDAWVTDLDSLEELELFSNNDTVLAELMTIKHRNKLMLARLTKELTGIQIDPASLFDVHAAPFQEHKRHLLTLLWVIGRYWSIIEDGVKPQVPRAIVFAGKAAPGAFMAKLVIKMVHSVAAVVNADPRSREWLRVAFLPDYRVTLAEHIMPGAELSEHLSSPVIATTETGCLKAALNGALMITTRHGIARELCRVFGESNIFMFDGDIEGTYQPDAIVQSEPESRRVLNSLESGYFCRGDRDLVSPLIKRLLSPGDNQRSVGHLRSYMARQKDIDSEWMDQRAWAQKSLLNIARMGQFSCDRTIHEYAQKVWHLSPSTGARLAKERD